MSGKSKLPRRDFLKQAAGVIGAATQSGHWTEAAQAQETPHRNVGADHPLGQTKISYPRVFEGRQLKMISFPLGGVAAGSLGLGGRGQLRDWEIFNRPNQGGSPAYAFPAIWIQSGNSKPIAHVLESRILPPYQGESGLGSNNAPGLSRLEGAKFTGEYPLAHIDFEDRRLPVKVELDAFSPFIPHDPDDSGLPVAVLRYRVSNPGLQAVKVGIAFSIDNPVAASSSKSSPFLKSDTRLNEYRVGDKLKGLLMSNPSLPSDDPMHGSFVLAAMPSEKTNVTYWRGWPKEAWWTAPLLYWDEFSKHGQLGTEPSPRNAVGALCQQTTIAAGQSASDYVSAGMALSQSHTSFVRMVCSSGRGKYDYRQLLRHPLQGCMGSRAIYRDKLAAVGDAHSRFRQCIQSEHGARCGEGSCQRQPVDSGFDNMLPHGRRGISRI